jgi:hypothetical protein
MVWRKCVGISTSWEKARYIFRAKLRFGDLGCVDGCGEGLLTVDQLESLEAFSISGQSANPESYLSSYLPFV